MVRLLSVASEDHQRISQLPNRKGVCSLAKFIHPYTPSPNTVCVIVVQVCTVFFHSIDFVLQRPSPRKCYRYQCYTPKVAFMKGKDKKKVTAKKRKCTYFDLFQRMLAVKKIVYGNHRRMLRLYEAACEEDDEEPYWGPEDDVTDDVVKDADDTNEVLRDDEF